MVVCVYTEDRWDLIRAGLASLHGQREVPDEVVVVVDHNVALRDRLRDLDDPLLRVIDNLYEPGLSGARNTGVEGSTGDVIAFLDDDARAEPGWLEAMLGAFDDPSVAGVGGRVIPEWIGERPAWLPDEFLWVVGCSYRGQPTTVAEIRNPIGASMAFRREAFTRAGLFDARVGRNAVTTAPLGCEETLFSLRLREAWPATKIVQEPRSVAHHSVPASRGTWAYFLRRCYSEGISKRLVSASVTKRSPLGVERGYVVGALAPAVGREVRRFVRRPGWVPLARIFAVGLGVASAGLGYLRSALD